MIPQSLTAERTTLPTPSPQTHSTSSRVVRFVPVDRLLSTLSIWRARARQRQALSMLSDYHLGDIGLTRADVDEEVRKRFWQA